MECLSARTSAFVFAVSFLLVPPSHAEESQSRVPSYIEADRTQAEETLGGALANDVFSDRFTALRKRLIASSLRANPAAGCGAAPAFTLQIVVGVERSPEASAWQEVYVIRCKVDVRRTFLLFLSPKDGMKSVELAPGGRRDLATGRPSGRVGGCDDWSGYGSRLQARASPRHAGDLRDRSVEDALDRGLDDGCLRHFGRC
jgi:hypothetical protein